MTDRRSLVTPQLVFGLLVCAFGIILLLGNLGFAEARSYLRFWPVALMALGAAKVLQARSLAGTVAGLAWVFLGTWILGWNTGWIQTNVWWALRTYWPALLVFFGLSLVWSTIRRNRGDGAALDSRNEVKALAMLGGVKWASDAPDFQGGEITAVMGGAHLDLRRATLHNRAVIDTFAMWGGIEVVVPDTWAVELRGTPILGGFEDKTRGPLDPNAPRLVVRGIAMMGGVEIKNQV
jgi:predicted membrane protein